MRGGLLRVAFHLSSTRRTAAIASSARCGTWEGEGAMVGGERGVCVVWMLCVVICGGDLLAVCVI